MSDRFPERIPDDATITEINLDDKHHDVVFHGKRLTERRAERIGEAAARGKAPRGKAPRQKAPRVTSAAAVKAQAKPGRPSLSAPGTHSPVITVRLPKDLRAAVDARAREDDVAVSELVRRALEAYTHQDH